MACPILHGRADIRNLSSSVEKYFTSERKRPCNFLFYYIKCDDFSKISDLFPKISEDFPKLARMLDERFQTFSKISGHFPKFTEDCRGRPKKI